MLSKNLVIFAAALVLMSGCASKPSASDRDPANANYNTAGRQIQSVSSSQSRRMFDLVSKIYTKSAAGKKSGLPGSDCAAGKCFAQMMSVTFGLNSSESNFTVVNFKSLYKESTFLNDEALVGELVQLLREIGYKFAISNDRADDGGKLTQSPLLPEIVCSLQQNNAGQTEYNCDITLRVGVGG